MVEVDLHCATLFIGWSILAYFLLLTGRYLKLVNRFVIHVIAGLALLMITLVLGHLGSESREAFRAEGESKLYYLYHKVPGALVKIGTGILVINAFILRLHNRKMKLVWTEAWSRSIHFFGGYGTFLISFVACFTGEFCRMRKDNNFSISGYLYTIFFLILGMSLFGLDYLIKYKFSLKPLRVDCNYTQDDINRELSLGKTYMFLKIRS